MRILRPKPGARLAGAFLSDSVFVGIGLWRRDELPFKGDATQTLRAKKQWRELILESEEILRKVLGQVAFARPLKRR